MMLLAGQNQYGSVSEDNRFAMDRGCKHQDECGIVNQWEAIVICVQSHTEDTSASEPTSWCSQQVDDCVNCAAQQPSISSDRQRSMFKINVAA